MSRVTQTARVVLDILIFAAVCFAEFAIRKWFTPYRRGFFCGDESLQYPFRESTLSVPTLIAIALIVPPLVLLVVELFKRIEGAPAESRNQQAGGSSGCRLGYRLKRCYIQIGIFLFGLGLTVVASSIGKYCVGRLRPHFFDVCQPQFVDGSTCEDFNNHGRYFEQYTCVNAKSSSSMIKDLSQSFPSAHASILFYAMLYTAIYLQASLSTRGSKLLKHALQFVFVFFAWYVSLTRITDHMHHWSDVLAGMVLGSTIAIVVALFVADLFGARRREALQLQQQQQVKSLTVSSTATSAKSATPVLPAYTFGTVPYLPHHPHQYAATQTYHNYGYVP